MAAGGSRSATSLPCVVAQRLLPGRYRLRHRSCCRPSHHRRGGKVDQGGRSRFRAMTHHAHLESKSIMKRPARLSALFGATALVAACGGGGSGGTTEAPPSAAGAPAPAAG